MGKAQDILVEVHKRLGTFPETLSVHTEHGRPEDGTDNEGVNMLKTFVRLKPHDQWTKGRTKTDLIQAMRASLTEIPGVRFNFSQPIKDSVEEAVSGVRGKVVLKVFGTDLAAMRETLRKAKQVLQDVPGVTELDLYRDVSSPQLQVQLDRSALARAGVPIEDAAKTIETALAGRIVTEVWEGERPVPVRVMLPLDARDDLDKIGNLGIATPSGASVPLRQFASLEIANGVASIVREGNVRFLALKFNVHGRDMGSVVKDAIAVVDKEIKPPEGHYFAWGGEFENQERATQRLKLVVPVAVLLVLVLLYAAMNSGRSAAGHPVHRALCTHGRRVRPPAGGNPAVGERCDRLHRLAGPGLAHGRAGALGRGGSPPPGRGPASRPDRRRRRPAAPGAHGLAAGHGRPAAHGAVHRRGQRDPAALRAGRRGRHAHHPGRGLVPAARDLPDVHDREASNPRAGRRMKSSPRHVLALLLSTAVAAQAQSVVPPEAVELHTVLGLVRQGPRLTLENQNVAAAQAERRIASAYPNPTVRYGRSWQPGTQTNFSSNRANDVSVDIPLLVGGQLAARRAAADHGIAAARARVSAAGNDLSTEVGATFVHLLAAQERRTLLAGALSELARMRDVVAGRQASGVASQFDLRRLDLELVNWKTRATEAEADVADQQAQLATLLGYPNWQPEARGELKPLAVSASADGASQNPAVIASHREMEVAEANVDVARRERLPAVSASVGRFWTPEPFGSTNSVGISVELPVFGSRGGELDKARVEAASARMRRELLETEVRANVARYAAQVAQKTAALDNLRRQAGDQLAGLRQMADDAYRLGRSSILELLDTTRTRYETGLSQIELTAGLMEAQIRLQGARGEFAHGEVALVRP